MDERQKISRRRAIEMTIAATAVAALATETLLKGTPEAEAGIETMKDNYHEVVNAPSIDARRQVAVLQKASGRLQVAVAKPVSERVTPGKSLGQYVAEFKGAEIPADFFPGAILANPDGKSMLISSGNAGVGGGQRVLFASKLWWLYLSKY
jgi:hypothetical protein